MSTGRLVESVSTTDNARRPDFDTRALELRLVVAESQPERGIPPELVLADLNAFIDEMG
jgi:hypothetical protein